MRSVFLLLLISCLCALEAAGLSITPGAPWKAVAENEYFIDYQGQGWPVLTLNPASMKPNAYYKVTWYGKVEGGQVKNFFEISVKNGNKSDSRQQAWWADGNYNRYTCYFKNPDQAVPTLRFSVNPGPGGKVYVKNIAVTALTDAELKNSLLPDGDFESCNTIPTAWSREDGQGVTGNAIVASPMFLCGTKSLQMSSAKVKNNVLISPYLPARPGKTYILSFWARGSADVPFTATINYDGQLTKGGKHLYKAKTFKVDKDWKLFSFAFPIPNDLTTYPALQDGTAKLQLHLNRRDDDVQVWLDLIEFREE